MLLRWWKQRHDQGLVGLDIGSNSVKLMEINSTTKPYVVKNFATAPLPDGLVVKDEIKDHAALGALIKELFRKNNIQTKAVALAIPRSSVIIKNIQVNSQLNAADIESRAWVEANHHFPDLVGEIYLDFSVTPIPQDPSQLDLTLVACRKTQIKPYLDVLHEAGLNAEVIDVNSYALERAVNILMEEMPQISTVALLNLDMQLSTLLVVQENKLIYAHDQAYDGKRLVTQTKEYLQSATNQIATLNDSGYLETLKNALSAHLRHTMHFFYSSRPNIGIQKLILSGDCAATPCLDVFLQQEVGADTVLANPFEKMIMTPDTQLSQLQQIAPTMMLSLGLALSQSTHNNHSLIS